MSSSDHKPKLVVMLSRFPYPLEKGDKLRAYHQLKELSNQFEVVLITLSDQPVTKEGLSELEKYCNSIHVLRLTKWSTLLNTLLSFLSKRPFQVGYFYRYKHVRFVNKLLSEIKPDHIYSQLIRTTEYTKNYHLCSKTLDYMDALSKGIERRIEKAPWYSKWAFKKEAKRLRDYERTIFDYFENKTMITELDARFVMHPDREQIVAIPNGVDESFIQHQCESSKEFDLVFVGNMSYAPNIDAVHFIAKEILPEISKSKILISGATPHPSIKKLSESTQIELSGWVDDIRTAYCKANIFFAPMMIGTGMQNKLLEAMALEIPCITTSLANNAIGAIHGESIIVADSKEEMILWIQKLLKEPELAKKIASNGKAFVASNFSWQHSTNSLIRLMEV